MVKELKGEWEKVKTERKKQYHNDLKKWKATVSALLKKPSEADFLSTAGYDPGASSSSSEEEEKEEEEEEEEA